MTISLFAPTALELRELEDDTAAREDDPTPRELERAILDAAMVAVWRARPRRLDGDPMRVLDVCAGYGCWSSELRSHAARKRYGVHITGVEICEARRADLAKWCDRVEICSWLDVVEHFDVVIGNPHFSALVGASPAESMPAVLLDLAPAVLLLHQSSSFQRGLPGVAAWRHCPPARVWLVPGSVQFRRGTNPKNGKRWGSDQRCYQASLWLRGHPGPTAVELLPDPPDGRASWRWTVPPGSEDPSDELPAAPASK